MHAPITIDPQWSPQHRFSRPEDIELSRLADFEMTFGDLLFACRFQALRGADRLFVILRSSRNVPFAPVPVFYDEYKARDMNGHVLAVCDPTLFFDGELEVGAFYGTRRDDAVSGLIRIAEKTASLLGLDRTRIIYWAPSGAAIGAAMAAIRSGATAVVVNPYLDAINMGGSQIAATVARIFGSPKPDDLTEESPLRTRVPAALAMAHALGIHAKLLVVQNTMDTAFHKRQFLPFCRSLSVPLEGGWDPTGRIMSMIYSDPSGHGRETPEVCTRILREVLPQMMPDMSPAKGPQTVVEVSLGKVGTNVYAIPAGTAAVRIVSGARRHGADPRMLGAAVTRISVDGQPIPIADPSLIRGFYDVEREGLRTWRWTDGRGEIPILDFGNDKTFEVEVAALASDEGP